jgi:hypothetical protein
MKVTLPLSKGPKHYLRFEVPSRSHDYRDLVTQKHFLPIEGTPPPLFDRALLPFPNKDVVIYKCHLIRHTYIKDLTSRKNSMILAHSRKHSFDLARSRSAPKAKGRQTLEEISSHDRVGLRRSLAIVSSLEWDCSVFNHCTCTLHELHTGVRVFRVPFHYRRAVDVRSCRRNG